MKRIVLLIILMIGSLCSLKAQIQIVPKMGVLYSNIQGNEPNLLFEGKAGFALGGDLRLGKKWLFQPGLYWQAHNVDLKGDSNSANPESIDERLNFQRVHLPLMGVYKFNLAVANLRAGTGLSYSFMTFYKENGVITKDMLQQNQLALDAEIGADILFINLDVHASYGLNDFVPDLNGSNLWWISFDIGFVLM